METPQPNPDDCCRSKAADEENEQIKALKREVAELRRETGEILKAASGLFRPRTPPATGALVRFISGHADTFGVEPVCRVLSENGPARIDMNRMASYAAGVPGYTLRVRPTSCPKPLTPTPLAR
jgi:hypothetical protein